ncbi:hypothetical protein, partial [Acinetobacter nosocomialis]|uniref:hypothetical protein n=1 Tax=Acinetobacter nosocomialis TaxID=106654 RepID=UPI00374F8F5A
MGSCAAPSAKGDDKFITTDYLQQCRYIRLLDGEQALHHQSPHLLHCLTLQRLIHPLQQYYPFTLLYLG